MSEADVCKPPATYAVLWDRSDAVEALNERRIELGWSMLQVDHSAKQAEGTAAKYFGPGGTKGLGLESMFKMARALGMRVVFEVDPAATAELIEKAIPRQATQARPGNFAQKCAPRIVERALRHLVLNHGWNEILQAVSGAHTSIAAEQIAKAARKDAANPADKPHKQAKRPTPTAAAAYDAPMVTAMSEFAP